MGMCSGFSSEGGGGGEDGKKNRKFPRAVS
jgi:hypothetical protein